MTIADAPQIQRLTELEEIASESTVAPNILEAIRRVTGDIGRIAKSGRGPSTQNSYPFMPIDDIVGALQPLLAEHGIVVVSKALGETIETDVAQRYNQDGTPARDGRHDAVRTRVRSRFQFKFVSVADGSKVKVVTVGEAHDTGDKASNKAETAAYKKALTRTFSIAPGETDPDTVDPNEQAEQQAAAPARRTRRERSIDQSRGTAGRTPAPAAPAPVRHSPAQPIEQHDAHEPTAEERQAHQAAQRRADQAAISAPPETVTEAKAEQQAQAWRPDPADVAHAEQHSPAPAAPAAPAPAPTQTEQRAEQVSEVKSQLRRAWSARGLTREQANAIGDKVTGVERTVWMLRVDMLKTVLKAIENGETAE